MTQMNDEASLTSLMTLAMLMCGQSFFYFLPLLYPAFIDFFRKWFLDHKDQAEKEVKSAKKFVTGLGQADSTLSSTCEL